MTQNKFTKIKKRIGPMMPLTIILILIAFASCKKNNSDPSFKADFSYEFTDNNHVQFLNKSEGEYYSLIWDFGNGLSDTTTDKKKSYQIYYPQAGNYDVSLRLMNFTGKNLTVIKTINVASTDLQVSFTAGIDPANPNLVNLKNTTTGEFDSFKWLYRTEVVDNQMEFAAYFPFAGTYEIELKVFKYADSYSVKHSVTIAQDDPDYVPNLTLAWSDEFDGTAINANFWTFETGATGWGNAELQNYTNGDNAEVVDGKLIITARKVNDNTEPGSYTSTRIVTKGKKEFKYGRMEIRAKLPSGTGVWPAIWMLGTNFSTAGWPACGEMDIMEYVGYQPNIVYATVHTTAGSGGSASGNSMTVTTCEEEFHNYGVIWTENKLIFYVDSTDNVIHVYSPAVKTAENWPFDQPGFFVLNLAVGGTWGGAQGVDNSIFPQNLEIDYVRVYQETAR